MHVYTVGKIKLVWLRLATPSSIRKLYFFVQWYCYYYRIIVVVCPNKNIISENSRNTCAIFCRYVVVYIPIYII